MINKLINYIKNSKKIDQRVTMISIITKNGRVLSIGHNNKNRLSFPYKTENKYPSLSGIHAEMDSIRKCFKSQLKGATITIIGINTRSWNQVMSKPCEACMNAIKEVGIKRIIYFDKDEKKYIEKVK